MNSWLEIRANEWLKTVEHVVIGEMIPISSGFPYLVPLCALDIILRNGHLTGQDSSWLRRLALRTMVSGKIGLFSLYKSRSLFH